VHEVPSTGAWQRGRLRLPVKQSPTGHGGSNPSAPTNIAGLAQLAERRPPKPKVRGSTPWSGARHLDVAKWLKAAACKAAGASPHPFESDRRVQFSSPIAQMAERLAVNQEARGSKPRRGASFISVWRSRERTCFGSMRSQVRGLPPRPSSSVCLGVAVAQWQSCGL
jgi:hypothetical protein